MSSLQRDDSASPPAPRAGEVSSISPPLQVVRHLKIVPRSPGPEVQPPPLAEEDWAQLMQRVAERRDREAFSRLFEHFAPRVKSYLIRTGSSEQAGEDLAQDALVMVWRKAELFDATQAAVSTWIFTIARRLRIDAARRLRPQDDGTGDFDFDQLASDQPGVPELADTGRLSQRVRDALDRLPPEQAQVLRLCYYDDEPHARIASELGLPLGTVKSRIRLAVAHLRRLIDP